MKKSFRPQQGLTIMNFKQFIINIFSYGFRPQQGLTIMNQEGNTVRVSKNKYSFRPQQGLTIMNPYLQNPDKHYLK